MIFSHMPKISIITPCYNAEKYIAKAIDSVIDSTFTDWEHIIVDDGSTDNSAEIILNYLNKEPRLRLIKQPNSGVCNARNNGFKACSPESEYLMFFDADDCIDPQTLEIMVKYLDSHPHVGFVYSDEWFTDNEDRIFKSPLIPRFFPSPSVGFEEVPNHIPETPLFSIAIGVCKETGPVLRKSVYIKTSGWPEWLGQGFEGIDFYMQMALISDCHFIPQKLYKYRQHDTQSHKSVDWQTQYDKVIAKWQEGKGLTPEQKAKITEVLDYIPAYKEFLFARDKYLTGQV